VVENKFLPQANFSKNSCLFCFFHRETTGEGTITQHFCSVVPSSRGTTSSAQTFFTFYIYQIIWLTDASCLNSMSNMSAHLDLSDDS